MPAYFASDVHMRRDRPDRDRRFADWVDRLGPGDSLVIVGDLCDFWYASRQLDADPMASAGLRALAGFVSRGGSLTIMPGNHDTWLGPFYERTLGARFVPEPLDLDVAGLRVRLVHGHLLGARRPWKAWMETRTFLESFRRLPRAIAGGLDRILDRSNERNLADSERRHLALYRDYADRQAGTADLVVFGHVHRCCDDDSRRPRLVVLGGWHHRSSYLRIDPTGAVVVVEPGSTAREPGPMAGK